MARPKANIDLVELEKLCGLQCTDEEAAAFLGISTRTLQRRRQNKKFARRWIAPKQKVGFQFAAIYSVWQRTGMSPLQSFWRRTSCITAMW